VIPVRVLLQNFLTYQGEGDEPVIFDFRGAKLWSIWGDNGAGKSAIFDAITYCLFGVHRGGAGQGSDADLLRKGESRMHVGFEFEVSGTLYRVTRTLTRRQRRSGSLTDERTQQADWFDPQDGVWRVIPGTESKAGLGEWIKDKIPFAYETFVASVMLLQGQSERLIQAKPDQRFGILGELIDLNQYEKLEELAKERARHARAQLESLEIELAAKPIVKQDEIEQAQARFAKADADVKGHGAKMAEAVKTTQGSKAYWTQVAQRDARRAEVKGMEALLAGAAEIRSTYGQYEEVGSAVRPIEFAIGALRSAAKQQEDANRLRTEAAKIDLPGLIARADEADKAEAEGSKSAQDAAEAPRRLRAEQTDLEPLVLADKRIQELEASGAAHAKRIAELDEELKRLPGLETELLCLDELGRARNLLEQIAYERSEREKLIEKTAPLSVNDALAQSAAALADARANVEAIGKSREEAGAHRHEAQAEISQATKTLSERFAAKSEGTCSHCGQKVNAEHIALELRKAEKRLTEAKVAADVAGRDFATDENALSKAQVRLTEAEANQKGLEDLARRLGESDERISSFAAQVEAAKHLPGWSNEIISASIGRLPGLIAQVKRELKRAEPLAQDRQRLVRCERERELTDESLRKQTKELDAITSASTPEQRKQATQRFEQLTSEIAGKERDARSALDLWQQLSGNARRLRKEADQAREKLHGLEAQASEKEAQTTSLRREADLRLEPVNKVWRDRALASDFAVLDELKQLRGDLADAPKRKEALEVAERDYAPRLNLLIELEASLDETPPEYKIPVDAAEDNEKQLVALGQKLQDERDATLDSLKRLADQRRSREELEAKVQTVARQRKLWERLVKLLGRGGLQARLMDEALKGITHYANQTLSRISNGQLEVKLTWHERGAREEIAIEATDLASADEALDVAFISGGQKFRTAVALAAGIGQYAGGAAGLDSLIIDEGFGSLDQQGREQMIDQLREVAQVMEKVIVVSHQEDFQDRRLFPAGYVLRKAGRKTVVSRAI
jgi:DNA repair exonuclease SbcCD ATPase subunit